MTLVATPGGATSNSYVTRTEADAYFGGRFGTSAWDVLSDADQDKALMQATRHIDRHLFHGTKSTTLQALQFPRDVQEEALSQVPRAVQEACCEEALWICRNIAQGGRSVRQERQAEGVESWRVGQASESFGRAGAASLCPEAMRCLAQWIRRGARIVSDREQVGSSRLTWPL